MSISGRLLEIKSKVADALDDYSEDLEKAQQELAPSMTDVMKDSIRTKSMGRLSRKVGIDTGYLLANEWNIFPKQYASLYIGGHRPSPWLPFKDGSWRQFPATDGNPFISNAFHAMSSFASYYHGK